MFNASTTSGSAVTKKGRPTIYFPKEKRFESGASAACEEEGKKNALEDGDANPSVALG